MIGVYATRDTTGFSDVSAGQAKLREDGVLIIKGKSGADKISVGRSKDTILVTINGKTSRFARNAAVRALFIQSGKGNDFVDVGSSIGLAAYIEAGSGNDTIRGSNASDVGHDTLIGNGGNDQLEGRGGNDKLFGQDGDDVLLGGIGSDALFGGEGDDALYASGVARLASSRDGWTDALTSGRGQDRIRRDRETTPADFIGDGDSDGDLTFDVTPA